MSLKKVGQVKADKGFKIFDLFIYGAIIALVIALFIAVFATRDTSPLKGISVYIGNDAVFEYNFDTDGYYADSELVTVTENGDGFLKITVKAGGGHNDIVIDKTKRSVTVSDADCSSKPDCVYTPAITDNSGWIYCLPHSLRIIPSDYVVDDEYIPFG